MDCLDRTNVAQFCFGRYALKHQVREAGAPTPVRPCVTRPRRPQLRALGVHPTREHFAAMWSLLLRMFGEHGDSMATQYGGSQAMHRATLQAPAEAGGDFEARLTGGPRNALVAVRRYYSNNFTGTSVRVHAGVAARARG